MSFIKIFRYIPSHRIIHSWLIPVLHAVLWAIALLFAQQPQAILQTNFDENILKIFLFGSIFIVLFLETIIVLTDIYIENHTNYLNPRFVLYVVVLFIALVVTFTSVRFAISGETIYKVSDMLLWIILSSSLVKFLENFLMNNTKLYIVTNPTIFDARGIYINHPLNNLHT